MHGRIIAATNPATIRYEGAASRCPPVGVRQTGRQDRVANRPDRSLDPACEKESALNLKRLFRGDPQEKPARALYDAAVAQARSPVFYAALHVPDTLDGRFELIVLHGFLIMHRLKSEPAPGPDLAQSLFDVMFADMDAALREMGAGDLGVGRRVKTMAKGFLGRVAAYESGLAEAAGPALEAALRRNLYGTVEPDQAALAAMSGYIRAAVGGLAAQPGAAILAGEVRFPAPPAGC
jgi:cytochrome b pre-mRNA-processing protein 3